MNIMFGKDTPAEFLQQSKATLMHQGITADLPCMGRHNGKSDFPIADARRVYLSGSSWRLLAVCVITLLNLCLAAWWMGLSLGLPLSLADYLVFIPVVTVITLVPVSVGGWGVREGALVALLGLVGVPSHMALAFSVLFGFAGIVVSLPAFGFLWSAPDREKATECDADLLALASAATASGAERDR